MASSWRETKEPIRVLEKTEKYIICSYWYGNKEFVGTLFGVIAVDAVDQDTHFAKIFSLKASKFAKLT